MIVFVLLLFLWKLCWWINEGIDLGFKVDKLFLWFVVRVLGLFDGKVFVEEMENVCIEIVLFCLVVGFEEGWYRLVRLVFGFLVCFWWRLVFFLFYILGWIRGKFVLLFRKVDRGGLVLDLKVIGLFLFLFLFVLNFLLLFFLMFSDGLFIIFGFLLEEVNVNCIFI